MKAAFCPAPRTIELRDVERPSPAVGEVIVRVRCCGICGSDLHWFHGGFPPPPVCPGHEIAGEIADVGSGVVGVRSGDRVAVEPLVTCGRCSACRTGDYQICRQFQILGTVLDGGLAEYVRVPAYAVFPLPAELDFEIGALTEPMAVCAHAARLGHIRLGDRVLVLGAGTIGLLSVLAARVAGATDVGVTARHPHQAALARRLGASQVFANSAEGQAQLEAFVRDHPVDVVIETVGGHADTLDQAIEAVRPGGTVVILGVFTSRPPCNALGLVIKEVRVIGSLTYGRSGPRADFDVAVDILRTRVALVRELITHRFELNTVQTAFETAADKAQGAIKVSVRCDAQEG